MTDVTDKVERAIARFDRVTQQLDQRGGPAQAAARRERQRLNAGLGRTVLTVAVSVALIWTAAIIIGLVAAAIWVRYLIYLIDGQGSGHLQSVIVGAVLVIAAVQLAGDVG